MLFGGAVLAGTVLDARARTRIDARTGNLLVADLHVHPYPGDGSLTIAQLQREATRRGVDVIAITGHNNRIGLALSQLLGTDPRGPIVIPGQEVTSTDFHMIAVGTSRLVDWTLSAAEATAFIQTQGGVAIAAHPVSLINAGWDDAARRALDGTEVMHPLRLTWLEGGRELDSFFNSTRTVNPGITPVGSSDFHMSAPLGLCRTYVLADDRTAPAVLDAIRVGRTAASCGGTDLVGTMENVAAVRAGLGLQPAAIPPSAGEKACACLALVSLGLLAWPSRQ